ncbi:hypothetical protein D770_09980 [Flammeovirgaceae bacterium 311]|nr:hypothetical protein D770_09980 [Flammeovirgaceae bacterium 311]
MPGLYGFAILVDMKALDIDRSRIYVTVLTSSISDEDRQKAIIYSDQVKNYLVKPLRKEDVEQILLSINF